MKKILVIISLVFLLTGCGIEYNIKITEDAISDDIKIQELSSKVEKATEKEVNMFVKEIMDVEAGYDYYERKMDVSGDYTFYDYKKEFSYEEYPDLSFLRNCFKSVTINDLNDEITFYAGEEFTCKDEYDIDSFVVNIISDYEVIDSNATNVYDKVYSWNINKIDDNIKIVFDKNKKINEVNKKPPLILVLGIIVIVILLLLRLKIKKVD